MSLGLGVGQVLLIKLSDALALLHIVAWQTWLLFLASWNAEIVTFESQLSVLPMALDKDSLALVLVHDVECLVVVLLRDVSLEVHLGGVHRLIEFSPFLIEFAQILLRLGL